MSSSQWFQADRYGVGRILPVTVDRATEASVWVGGRRRAIATDCEIYAPTWEAAHAWLLSYAEARVAQARRLLELANSYHGNVKGMKP